VSRLSDREFNAMNNPWRRLLQRWWEFPMLKRLGLPIMGRDVLEVGCGPEYGAQLLATLKPRSYFRFDFMPEQVALARKRMPEGEFILQHFCSAVLSNQNAFVFHNFLPSKDTANAIAITNITGAILWMVSVRV
jgi:SAM-dependent methyltransferase